MTSYRLVFFIFIFTAVFSCKENANNYTKKIRRIKVDDVFAEGMISSDSIYDGLIKFYDTSTNRLVIEAFYKSGKLDGIRKDYYLNGKIKNTLFYENGKQSGIIESFDSTGVLIDKQDFYYGLKVGNNIEYKNNKPNKYFFSDFDNNVLAYINYDSLYNKEIEKINNNHFFFCHINDVLTSNLTGNKITNIEYFIYLINPPNFNFEYSFCVINNKDSILRTEKKFDKAKIWDTFILDSTKLKKGERFTLRLTYDRDLNNEEGEKGVMLKRL